MTLAVKICGLKTPEALSAAVEGGARFVGFVFFPRSPRAVSPVEAARLAVRVPPGVQRVAVVVDAADQTLEQILTAAPFEFLQCHGHETPVRVREIRERFRIPVIKALPVGDATDVGAATAFEGVADRLLFDARPPIGASLPGGNALSFDWQVLRGRSWRRPWLLAGGLNAGNLAEAVRASGAEAVDVSSGVETAPGEKDVKKIRHFLAIANTL